MSDPLVIVRGLCRRFGEHHVLDHLDVDLDPGEVVAIRGQSGTGKSTLLHCLGTLDQPDSGSIQIAGVDPTSLRGAAQANFRARSIGFIFQAFHLLPEFSALENILMPWRCAPSLLKPGEATARAQELLRDLGLAHRANSDVRAMSGGERQRIAIARALLLRPHLVLADEPTGNLDPVTAELVLDHLLRLSSSHHAAVVMVTHDPLVAARAHRRLHLAGGRLHTALPDGLS